MDIFKKKQKLKNKKKLLEFIEDCNQLDEISIKTSGNLQNRYLKTVKNDLQKQFNINIEYLELRNVYNLKLSNVINKSRLFVAYYINGVRLIDNL